MSKVLIIEDEINTAKPVQDKLTSFDKKLVNFFFFDRN